MKKIVPLWFVIFVSFFCYSSMLTMFVPMLQDKLSPLYIPEFSTAYRNILSGIYLSLYPLGQFFGAPIIGALSDRLGRKKMLIFSLILTTLCMLIIAYAIFVKSLVILAIGCIVAGLGESNMAIALSAIADLTTAETRSREFAKAWVMCSVGYISGSMFGAIAAFIGYMAPFIIQAVLVLLTLFSVIRFFNDDVQQIVQNSLKNIILSFISVFDKTTLRPYYLANFLVYIACFGVLRVELIYMQEHFGLSQFQIAVFYSYASIIALLANFLVTPILLKVMTVRRIILFAGIGAFASSIIFILPNKIAFLWLTTALIGFFIPITVAMSGAIISAKAAIDEQGSVMGNNQSLQVLAEAVSAGIGGLVFAINQQIPFIMFTVIGIMSLGIFKHLKR